MSDAASFGKIVSDARKAKELSQKELAGLIRREDGEAISPQYLNDIEHDRRSPAPEVIVQFAKILDLSPDYLHLLAGKWPEDVPIGKAKPEDVHKLMVAIRKTLRRSSTQ